MKLGEAMYAKAGKPAEGAEAGGPEKPGDGPGVVDAEFKAEGDGKPAA